MAKHDMRAAVPRLKPFSLMSWAFSPSGSELWFLAFTLLVVWLCELAIPLLLGSTVDAAISATKGAGQAAAYCLAAVVVALVLYGAHAMYLRAEAKIVARATFDLRRHLYSRVLEQPLSGLRDRNIGEIAHAIMADADVIERHGIYLFAEVPFAALTVLGVSAAMLWLQARLAIVTIAALTLAALLTHASGRRLGASERNMKEQWVRLGGRIQEVLDGLRIVKIFGQERYEVGRLDEAATSLARAETDFGRIVARLEPLLELVKTAGFLATVGYGAWLISTHALSAGALVTFVAFVELVSGPIQNAGRYYVHFAQAQVTMGRICEFLQGLEWPERRGKERLMQPLSVDMRDVRVTTAHGEPVLDGVTLSASRGDIVAIVGPNGAGKSTLLDVLLGLRSPESGALSIGGTPIEEWDMASLRRLATAVPQECFLFHGTVEDNIRYGHPGATADAINATMRRCGLGALVSRLPRGAQTVVGGNGCNLSGGERQLVALARALIMEPAILVLDEPTTGLDAEACEIFRSALFEGRDERIAFLVAHDWATVSIANRVVVLEKGRAIAGSLPGPGLRPDYREKSAMDAAGKAASMRADSNNDQEPARAPP